MATINGVYHPTDDDPYGLTGDGPGDGDLGAMAVSAAHHAIDAAAAAAEDAWNRRWDPEQLPFGANLNTVTDPGQYIVRSLSTVNRPPTEAFGALNVQHFGGGDTGERLFQTYTAGWPKPELWVRRSMDAGSSWDEWVRIDAAITAAQNLSGTTDLNDVVTEGRYIVRNLNITNRPGGQVFGTLDVQPFGQNMQGHTDVMQTFKAGYSVPQLWVRRLSNGTWDEWVQVGAAPESGDAGVGALRRDLLQQGLRARKGGTIGTNGRAVVSLRFDDAAGDFYRDVLPLLVERGLPFTRVTTTDRVGKPAGGEDDTWANMQSYCLEFGGEVFNHGKTHGAASGAAAIDAEVTGALATLRANLPRIPVDCWTPPGGQQTGWDGYMPIKTIENLVDSYAGSLILSHHALATGYLPDSWYQPLDGVIRDGQTHWTADIRDEAFVVDLIDRTMNYRTGLSLLWHANNFDTEGYMSMSDFVAVLDYIVAKRDAGEILVLTVSGMAVADRASAYREDFLPVHSGDPLNAPVRNATQRRGVAGATVELTATVTGTAGATVTSTIGESVRAHTIPAGGTLALRHCATIPLDVTNPLPVSIDAPTTDAHLMPV